MRDLELSRRRHDRIPLRGRRVLLHRDEHPHPGRASRHRKHHRHRSGAASRSGSPPAAPLSAKQSDIAIIEGHAIECRINAENPQTFRPSPGRDHPVPSAGRPRRAHRFWPPIRATSIPPYYDSLVGKLIVHGKTRGECLMRLRRALDELVVDGIETTLPLFRALVREPDIIEARLPHPLAGTVPRRPALRRRKIVRNPGGTRRPLRTYCRVMANFHGDALNPASVTRPS